MWQSQGSGKRPPSSRSACLRGLLASLLIVSSAGAADVNEYRDRPDAWFDSAESRQVLDSILSWQSENGGWWKAYDASRPKPVGRADKKGRSIFDNGATWSELRLLARGYTFQKDDRYRKAFDRGLAMTLDAQYPNGGWPQEYPPPPNSYARHITFNDEAMVNVMRLLRDIARGEKEYRFVDDATRERCRAAYEKGLECIYNCQIRVNGQLTVWCAQHDEKTLAPAKARSYELPSLSGGESAGVALFLMEIEEPDDRAKQSINAAVRWYEQSKLIGLREERKPDPSLPKGYDVVVVNDPTAPPLWARFYDLETGAPFYCGRDGVKKASLAEIEAERRAGYAWLRPWGQKVLQVYPKWAKRRGVASVLINADSAAR